MKISSKLLLSFCFINLLVFLSSVLVYHQLGRIGQAETNLLELALPALQRDEAIQPAQSAGGGDSGTTGAGYRTADVRHQPLRAGCLMAG